MTVAPEASEFTLAIVAEPTAAAAEAAAQLTPAPFKVGTGDYTLPPVPLAVKIVP